MTHKSSINWSDEERAAWTPRSGRLAAIDEARRKLRVLQAGAEGFAAQLQVVRGLLDAPKGCCCNRILPAMPRGGGNGSKTAS